MTDSSRPNDSMLGKKFIAYLAAELTWKAIILAGLLVFKEDLTAAGLWGWSFLVVTTIIAGFVEVVYIGKQADLDRFVRVAEITAGRMLNPSGEDPPPPSE